ncbi:hypothetical protein [Chitinophaga rhizophila]|nr:hypothetical protein [Chitinophaga rhizophila]
MEVSDIWNEEPGMQDQVNGDAPAFRYLIPGSPFLIIRAYQ